MSWNRNQLSAKNPDKLRKFKDPLDRIIPDDANQDNQLVDKKYVNEQIVDSDDTYRGTSAKGLTLQQFLAWANSLEKNINDYVFWDTLDEQGNRVKKRYKFNGEEWVYEYDENAYDFTEEQLAAINSGITSQDKNKLSDLPTNTELNTLLDGKVDGEEGKGLSANDYTNADKEKLINLPTSVELEGRLDGKADKSDLSSLEGSVELLQQQYQALTQSDIIVGPLPLSGVANKIYRVPGTTDYSDYMWYNNDFVLMATYNNAIDDTPTANSNNLVKSGGIKTYVDEHVSVSQNTSTGHTEIHIGSNDYPVASVDEVSQLGQEVENGFVSAENLVFTAYKQLGTNTGSYDSSTNANRYATEGYTEIPQFAKRIALYIPAQISPLPTICYYDHNKAFISPSIPFDGPNGKAFLYFSNVPEGAYYARFSRYSTDAAEIAKTYVGFVFNDKVADAYFLQKKFEIGNRADINTVNLSRFIGKQVAIGEFQNFSWSGISNYNGVVKDAPRYDRISTLLNNLYVSRIRLSCAEGYEFLFAAFDRDHQLVASATWSWMSGPYDLTGDIMDIRLSVRKLNSTITTPDDPHGMTIESFTTIDNYFTGNDMQSALGGRRNTGLFFKSISDFVRGNLDANGAEAAHGGRFRTGYYELDASIPLQYIFGASAVLRRINTYFYDAEKTFISRTGNIIADTEVSAPDGAKYVRFVLTYDAGTEFTYSELLAFDAFVQYKDSDGKSIAKKLLATAAPEFSKLRVVAYNIGKYNYGVTPSGLADYDNRLPFYKQFIGEVAPDVMFMEEFVPMIKSGVTSDAALFGNFFKYKYTVESGTAMRSRYVLSSTSSPALNGEMERLCAKGYINVDGKRICVMTVHLYPNIGGDQSAFRAAQMQDIITIMANEDYYIVAGDFNCITDTEYATLINAGLNVGNCDYWGTHFTYPGATIDGDVVTYPDPIRPLDNIVTSPNIKIVNFKVLTDWVQKLTSDHIPIMADLLVY